MLDNILINLKSPAKTVIPSWCKCFASSKPNPLSQPVIKTAFPAGFSLPLGSTIGNSMTKKQIL